MTARRVSVVLTEDGDLVSYANAGVLPHIDTPGRVGYGGIAFGWLETWRLRQHNQAISAYASYLKTLVSIKGYESELSVITDWKNIQNKIQLAGESIAFDLEELRRKARRNKELEDVAIEARAIELELSQARRKAQTIELCENALPVEERIRNIIQHFSKLIADTRAESSFSTEDGLMMCSQFEAIRDAKLVALSGKPLHYKNNTDKADNAKTVKTQAEKDEECRNLSAECAFKCAILRSDVGGDAHTIKKSIETLVRKMEATCQGIQNT